MKRNIMIIANPQSGKSDSEDFEKIIKEQLEPHFEDIIFEYTEDKGHATKLAKKACDENFDSVCSVGGDGTLGEVLAGLVGCENPPKLLIFPAGTGNIMSKALGYNQDKKKVFSNIDFDNPKNVDVGKVGDKIFSFLLSIGNIPESINEVSNEEKEKFGFMAYVGNVLKNTNKDNNYELKVEVGDKVYEGKIDHVAVTLSEKFGPFKVNNLESSYDDGLFNVFILKDNSIWSKAKLGIEGIFGDVRENESIEYFQGSNVKISNLNNDEIHVDLDGDQGPTLPIEIEMITKKIRVYVPKQ